MIKEQELRFQLSDKNEVYFFVRDIEGFNYMLLKKDISKVMANKKGSPPKVFSPDEAETINSNDWHEYIFVMKDGASPVTPENQKDGPYANTHPIVLDFTVEKDPIKF